MQTMTSEKQIERDEREVDRDWQTYSSWIVRKQVSTAHTQQRLLITEMW